MDGRGQVSKPVIVVAGFGRCGSSLVMQMLARCYVPTVGRYPDFEAQGKLAGPGKAVKWLDPIRVKAPFPHGQRAIVIWLDRDTEQQARSILKMMKLVLGAPVEKGSVERMKASLDGDRRRAIAILGQHRLMELRFEDLIGDPVRSTERIGSFVERFAGYALNPETMRDEIIERPTGPDCMPDLFIEESLITTSDPAAREEALSALAAQGLHV